MAKVALENVRCGFGTIELRKSVNSPSVVRVSAIGKFSEYLSIDQCLELEQKLKAIREAKP